MQKTLEGNTRRPTEGHLSKMSTIYVEEILKLEEYKAVDIFDDNYLAKIKLTQHLLDMAIYDFKKVKD